MENCVETASVVMVSELSIGLGEGCQVFRLVLFGCAWWHWYQCGLCTIGVYVGFLHYGVPITGDKAKKSQGQSRENTGMSAAVLGGKITSTSLVRVLIS